MSRAVVAGTIWLLCAGIAAVIVVHAHYSTDLSAFLPRRATATQRLLVEQLHAGPAAHLVIAAISGGDAAARAAVSGYMTQRLRTNPSFIAIDDGDEAQLQRDRAFLFEHRYLLSARVTPERFTAGGLHEGITEGLDVLASPAGPLVKPLFLRDPTLETLAIIESLDASHAPHTTAGVWSSPDGARALILAHTRASGGDIDGQQAALAALRAGFAAARAVLAPAQRTALSLTLSGPPVFAVASRATIRSQVWRLSSISAACIATLLLAVYRSLPVLAMTLVPVASGALAGVAAVALGFPAVHGLTLGFGVTLIGESVDYAIYFFIQRAHDFRRAVWPTLRLGVLTSVCGFAVLLPSAITGLAQLGLYSIAGLIAAALVTRFVLPAWVPRNAKVRDLWAPGEALERLAGRMQRGRGVLVGVALLAAALLYLHRDPLFSRELASLSPISAADMQLDERLRADSGAPDVRYLVVVSAADRESALAAAGALSARLTPLIDAGVLGGFASPSQFLPARETQESRRASLPTAETLRIRLAQALIGLPLTAARLAPFVQDVERTRTAALLSEADLQGTSLGRAFDALLVRSPPGWSALLPLSARSSGDLSPQAVEAVRSAVASVAVRAELLDLKGEADRLYATYLRDAVRLACCGLIAIVALLAIALRSARRVLRVMAPLLLSVLTIAALLVALGHALTILHVIGMLLIVAVGSNYALFFDRAARQPGEGSVPLILASLVTANLATVIAFGVLGFSSVPVLADLGSTVAPGTLLALLFAAMLADRPAPSAQA
ncbi:MAG TPA: MMPL family transporter [Steroidobacteraceae bacterium]|jgi:predicted exporter|nr:MMPL family transporter [Steroidobacteraceae bacterium]